MVFIFILSLIFFIIGLILFSKTHKINYENQFNLNQIKEEYNNLKINIQNKTTELTYLEDKKDNLISNISQIEKNQLEQEKTLRELIKTKELHLEALYTQKNQELFHAYEQYSDSLNSNYDYVEKVYKEKVQEIEKEKLEIEKELTSLKDLLSAAAKANLKEKEVQENLSFYTLQLDEKSKKEVKAIQDIEYILSDPRPLRMVVWTNYYSKKANDMCNRILGANKIIGIYKITNLQTKEVYIGQSKDIKERWREHLKCGLGIDTPAGNKLYASMKQYGVDNFSFELLCSCKAEELNEKEKSFIDLYDSYNFGMNSNRGISK